MGGGGILFINLFTLISEKSLLGFVYIFPELFSVFFLRFSYQIFIDSQKYLMKIILIQIVFCVISIYSFNYVY